MPPSVPKQSSLFRITLAALPGVENGSAEATDTHELSIVLDLD